MQAHQLVAADALLAYFALKFKVKVISASERPWVVLFRYYVKSSRASHDNESGSPH
jgi:hypothetical protein